MASPYCLRCKKALRDPASIERGYGPDCWAEMQKELNKQSDEVEGTGYEFATLPDDPQEVIVFSRNAEGRLISNIPQSIVKHSPTGMEIGYGGSGPADTALNILCRFKPREWVEDGGRYQDFKFRFIAPMDSAGGSIKVSDIRAWIVEQENISKD